MTESTRTITGLRTRVVSTGDRPRHSVIVLHGYAMTPDDLVSFAHSMGGGGSFYFPEGPLDAEPAGRAWWPIDQERRTAALALGARDLHTEHPAGARAARERLLQFVAAVRAETPGAPLALVGFSQGGMLACDTVLREDLTVQALALLSASRISADEWEPLRERVRGLSVLVSHGRTDHDLAFSAGEALRDLLARGGADVQWVPFDGGHEIPLVVWRGLRRLFIAMGVGR